AEPLELTSHGSRLHLVHGHRLGARPLWKAGMESRAFLHGFRGLPGAAARRLDGLLDRTNDRGRSAAEERTLACFRRHAAAPAARAALALSAHAPRPADAPAGPAPRLIVLGGWHLGSSYLRVDDGGARFVVA